MKNALLALIVIILAASVAFAETAPAMPSVNQVASETVAVVNGKVLTRDQLAALAVSIYGRELLDVLIAQEVIAQEAEKRGLKISETELNDYLKQKVDEQLNSIAKQMGKSSVQEMIGDSEVKKAAFEETRKKSEEALRPLILPQFLAEKMMAQEIKISDDELRAEFERLHGAKAKALQIVLRTQQDAEVVLAKIKQGADFKQLARENSIDPVSRRRDGEISDLTKGSILGDACFSLKPGQVTAVQSPDGYHVLKLVETTPPDGVKLDDVRAALRDDMIKKQILEQREQWVANLMSKADIRRTLTGSPQTPQSEVKNP